MNGITERLTWRSPIIGLPESHAVQFKQRLENLALSPYRDAENFLLHLRRAVEMLPLWLIREVRSMVLDPAAPGGLLLRGLPLDDNLPPTPARGETITQKPSFVAEGVLLGVSQLLGEPFGYHTEKKGALIHSVAPVQGAEQEQSNQGSGSRFHLHTETGFSPLRPELLLLYCLRQDHDREAGTLLASIRDACRRLDERDRQILRQPRFEQRAGASYRAEHKGVEFWAKPRPIMTGPADLPEGCVTVEGMRALDDDAARALENLTDALHAPDVLQSARLSPGDLLIIDNRKAVHGRTSFRARFDGTDRWLLRTFVRSSLWEGRTFSGASRRIHSDELMTQ